SVPVWVALAAAAAVCGALWVWASSELNAASDSLLARAVATPPSHMPELTHAAVVLPLPPPPAPPRPAAQDRLHTPPQGDFDGRALALLGTPATPVIRIPTRLLFAPGSATLQNAAMPLLDRIAAGLRSEPGTLRVVDYSDNQPVRTVQFPSSFQLSNAR